MSDSDDYPRSTAMTVLNGAGVFLILVSFILPVLFWSSLPDRVPDHFNIIGAPDGWGGKGMIFFIPVVGLILFGLITVASGSTIANYPFLITDENAERQYAIARMFGSALKVWLLFFITYIEWMMIRISSGKAQDLGWFAAVFLGGIIVIIAVYFVKAFLAR